MFLRFNEFLAPEDEATGGGGGSLDKEEVIELLGEDEKAETLDITPPKTKTGEKAEDTPVDEEEDVDGKEKDEEEE